MSSFPTSPLLDFKLLARSKPTVIESKRNVYTSISYCRVDTFRYVQFDDVNVFRFKLMDLNFVCSAGKVMNTFVHDIFSEKIVYPGFFTYNKI